MDTSESWNKVGGRRKWRKNKKHVLIITDCVCYRKKALKFVWPPDPPPVLISCTHRKTLRLVAVLFAFFLAFSCVHFLAAALLARELFRAILFVSFSSPFPWLCTQSFSDWQWVESEKSFTHRARKKTNRQWKRDSWLNFASFRLIIQDLNSWGHILNSSNWEKFFFIYLRSFLLVLD